MPELPEVETVRTGLEGALSGAVIDHVEMHRSKLRFALPDDFASYLAEVRFGAFMRRGKYLIIELENNGYLLAHLGMTGCFTVVDPGNVSWMRRKHDHIIFHMRGGKKLIYNDPRRFGILDIIRDGNWENHKLIAHLGIEPLGNEMNSSFLANAARNKQAPLKSFLLDQRIITGLGNIYVCEALYRASLCPRRTASCLGKGAGARNRAERLVQAIKNVLYDAISAGGSSVRDFAQSDGELGYFQHSFAVYGRDGMSCPTTGCDANIEKITQSGRSSFFCPRCQR